MEQSLQLLLAACHERAKVSFLEDQSGRVRAHDGSQADERRKVRETEAEDECGRQEHSAAPQAGRHPEYVARQHDAKRQRAEEKRHRRAEHDADCAVGHRLAAIGAGDHSADHRQDHQSQHVVDHRGAEDDASLGRTRAAEILQHTSSDPHARRGQGRAEKRMNVLASAGKEPRADDPSQCEWGGHAQHGDQERRPADLEHLTNGGFQSDLEQKNHDAELRENLHRGIGGNRFERMDPGEPEVTEHHTSDEFAQHCRLTETDADVPGELGGCEDDRECEKDSADWLGVHRITKISRLRRREHEANRALDGIVESPVVRRSDVGLHVALVARAERVVHLQSAGEAIFPEPERACEREVER